MTLATIIIIVHAALGGVALLSGSIATIAQKGNASHKLAGKLFFYSGLVSISLSLVVICLPGHWSPFLLSIGIFSLYFLIIGFRSSRNKGVNHSFLIDKTLTWIMAVSCVGMMIFPILVLQSINIVTLVFGLIGLFVSFQNLFAFAEAKELRVKWLRFHIIHMSAGFISIVSAFLVVNQFLPPLFNWFLPTIFGSTLIFYSLKKYTNSNQKFKVNNGILIIIFCSIAFFLNGQNSPKKSDLTIKLGLSKAQLKDDRLSAKSHLSWAPKFSISHSEVKENSRNHFQIDFISAKFSKLNKMFSIGSIHSNVHFAYQRKVANGTYVGGYINNFSLINIPKNPGQTFFVNNPVSYTISSSIGPSITYTHGFDQQFMASSTFQSASLSYVIQPIYGHPYPEKYMEEGVFSPTKGKIVGPMLRSGKFLSFKKFNHINILLSAFYVFDNNFKIGLDYNYSNYIANANGKAVKMKNKDILLTTGLYY